MYAANAAALKKKYLIDNGGRRFGDDRRFYAYNGHLPERRFGENRRSGFDRRTKPRLA